MSGTKPDATPISRTLAQSGRVVVIANQPLLEAGFASDGSRQLTLYGKAWMSYAILYSTNVANPAGWSQARYFAQTNMVTSLTGLGPAAPNAFYRAMEFTPDPPVLNALWAQTKRARCWVTASRDCNTPFWPKPIFPTWCPGRRCRLTR